MEPEQFSKQRGGRADMTMAEHLDYPLAFDLYTFRHLHLMLEIHTPALHQYPDIAHGLLSSYEKHLSLFMQKAEKLSCIPQIKKQTRCPEHLAESFRAFKGFLKACEEAVLSISHGHPLHSQLEKIRTEATEAYEKKANTYHKLMDSVETEHLLDELSMVQTVHSRNKQSPVIIENNEMPEPIDYTKGKKEK